MSNLKSVLVVSALLLALTISCNQESKVEPAYNETELVDMTNLSYQVHLTSTNALRESGINETRGFWSFLGKLCKVVVADATGATTGLKVGSMVSPTCGFIGAGVVGVASSISKAVDVWGTKPVEKHLSTAPKSSFIGSYNQVDVITGGHYGELHNRAMMEMSSSQNINHLVEHCEATLCEDEVDNAWRSMENHHRSQHVESEYYTTSNNRETGAQEGTYTPPYHNEDVEIFIKHDSDHYDHNQESCRSSFETIRKALRSVETKRDLLITLQSELGYSEEEASIMCDYVTTISKLPLESTQAYAEKISNTINSSDISSSEKDKLNVFISVALSSRVLWNNLEE